MGNAQKSGKSPQSSCSWTPMFIFVIKHICVRHFVVWVRLCSLHDEQSNFEKYAPENSQHQSKCWACVFALAMRAHAHVQLQLMNLCIALGAVAPLLKGAHTFIIVVHDASLASSHALLFEMKFVAVCCCHSQQRLGPSLYECVAQFFIWFMIFFAHSCVFVRRLLATDCDKCHSIVIYFMTFLWSTSSHQPGWLAGGHSKGISRRRYISATCQRFFCRFSVSQHSFLASFALLCRLFA